MIRELRKADINKVAEIWLNTNIKAHDFRPIGQNVLIETAFSP